MNKDYDHNDIEKLLSDKMNELSQSVDCFDKITERAFPQSDRDFSGSEFTVTGLENITGRSKRSNFIRWIAFAAAAALFVFVIPKTSFFSGVMSKISYSDKELYKSIVSEINDAAGNSSYISFDVPLDYYIANDVLITPLLSCPFEKSGRENVFVRVYIRMIGGLLTNQVYAVEYHDTYTASNFIAAAASKAEFSDSEAAGLGDNTPYTINNEALDNALDMNLCSDSGNLSLTDGKAVSAASFSLPQNLKLGDNIVAGAVTDVVYYHMNARFEKQHYYDIRTYDSNSDSFQTLELPDRRTMWKESVYLSGRPAFPDEDCSCFEKTRFFNAEPPSTFEPCWAAYYPLSSESQLPDYYGNKLELEHVNFSRLGVFSTIYSPPGFCCDNFRMYFSPWDTYIPISSKGFRDCIIICGNQTVSAPDDLILDYSPTAPAQKDSIIFSPYCTQEFISQLEENKEVIEQNIASAKANLDSSRSHLEWLRSELEAMEESDEYDDKDKEKISRSITESETICENFEKEILSNTDLLEKLKDLKSRDRF